MIKLHTLSQNTVHAEHDPTGTLIQTGRPGKPKPSQTD